jgi:hypothetical protein
MSVAFRPRPLAALWAAALAVTLAACSPSGGGSPSPSPSVASATSAVVTPSAVEVTAEPSPTPSWPARVPDDPTWTPNQLAAVQAVDAYNDVLTNLWSDPPNANFGLLVQVATDPQYTTDLNSTLAMIDLQKAIFGTVVAVSRSVGPEETVSGKQEIQVRQCQEDSPDSLVVENGVERPVSGSPRAEYEYVVQWSEEVQSWLVALSTVVAETC